MALAAQVAMFMLTHKHTAIALAIAAALMVVISRQPHLNAQRAIKFLHATAITENVALAAQVVMFMLTHKHTTIALAIAAALAALMVGKNNSTISPRRQTKIILQIQKVAVQSYMFCPRTVVIALFV